MQAVTYSQIEGKIRKDLDLQDTDNFIGYDEMAGYVNEGIDLAEAIILKIDEDYFLTKSSLSMVASAADILLPSDIYAQKIRAIIYKNQGRIFEVKRLRDPKAFLERMVINDQVTSTEEYMYFLRMDAGVTQAVAELTPPAYESGAYLTIHYIRNAARVPLVEEGSSRATQLATILDIPEFRSVLEQHAKMRCYEKMKDKVAEEKAEKKLAVLLETMVDTLTNRVPDRDDVVPQDFSHYAEMN